MTLGFTTWGDALQAIVIGIFLLVVAAFLIGLFGLMIAMCVSPRIGERFRRPLPFPLWNLLAIPILILLAVGFLMLVARLNAPPAL